MKARFTTIKLFLSQHLFFVGLVLLFVVLSFCSCGRAAADGMIQSDRDYIHSIIGDDWDSTQWDTVDSYMDSMPYFILFPRADFVGDYVLVLLPYSSNEYFEAYKNNGYSSKQNVSVSEPQIMPWFEKASGSNWETTDTFQFGYYYGGLMPYSLGNLQFDSNRGQYSYCVFDTWDNSLGTYGFGVELSDRLYSDSGWNFYWYSRTLRGKSGFYGSNGSFTVQTDWFNVKTNYNALFIAHSYTGFRFIEQNVFPVEYVSDDRLNLSTSLTGDGSKLLNIDLSAFRGSYTPAAGYTFSDVTLHLDCDGSDVPVIVNDSNSDLVNSWTPFNNRYVYITPYSVFDLGSYDDVYISGVDFSLTHSSPGGSDTEDFKISVEYYLKHETAPIESDSIPLDNQVDADKLSVTEIQNINNDFTFSEGEYVTDLGDILPPDNFSFVEIGLSNLSVSDLVSDGIQISDYYYFITDTVTSVMSEERVIYKFLNDTSYPNTFDYILFDYIEKVDGVYDHYYFYYITVSGRIRMQNNILADLYFDVNQSAYNTSAIYDFLYNRLNDFEDKSLVAFNSLIGLDRQQVQWLSTLNNTLDNGFYSVVAAINNIDIPVPIVFDDSDILDKLDDLITAVQELIDGNEVDTPQECIQYYYDNQNGTIDLAFVPAYYEGMTLDFLYSIQGQTQNNNRSGSKSGGSATFVNDSLIIQIFQQFKDSFTQNSISQNIRVFLSDITNDTGNHIYYFQLFHNDYDPEDFDGLAD